MIDFFSYAFGEMRALFKSLSKLNRQTGVVLLLAAILGIWKFTFGSYDFFNSALAPALGAHSSGIWSHAYLCISQILIGFMIPVLVLVFIFHKRPHEIGLCAGNVKLAAASFLIYLPLATIGGWFLSADAAFQHKYPMIQAVAFDWRLFAVYEVFFLFYWVGWEYLWRGFLLFGTAHTFGRWSVFIQMLPFAALHAQKPMPEAYLSILGALVLGALVWRCRAFWVAVPIHAFQMFAMDLFCILRLRWVVEGIIGR